MDTSGIYPRIHFLTGSDTDVVTRAVIYDYCGNITSSPGNSEILGIHKFIIEAVKKFRKSSKSDMVVLKLLSASPEVHPIPIPGWIIFQLAPQTKPTLSSIRIRSFILQQLMNHGFVTDFSVILKKLQHIQEPTKVSYIILPAISSSLLKETVHEDMMQSIR